MNPLLSPFLASVLQISATGLMVKPAAPRGDAVGWALTSPGASVNLATTSG